MLKPRAVHGTHKRLCSLRTAEVGPEVTHSFALPERCGEHLSGPPSSWGQGSLHETEPAAPSQASASRECCSTTEPRRRQRKPGSESRRQASHLRRRGGGGGPGRATPGRGRAAEGKGGTTSAPLLPPAPVCQARRRAQRAAALLQNSLLLTSEKPLPFPTPHSGHTCLCRSPGSLRRPTRPRRTTRFPPSPALLRRSSKAMSAEDYVSVNVEDDDEAVMIDHGENGLSAQSCVSMGQNSEVNSVHHVAQLAYGSEGLSVLAEQVASQVSHSASMQRGSAHSPEKMDFAFSHNKRKRLAPTLVGQNVMRTREGEYEDSEGVIYEYEPDYECETLLCSIMGVSARGRRTLDPNKIAAIREFLATNFPNYDLSEHGKDWKTCITNVNAMIRCLRSETKINPETAEGKEIAAVAPDTSHCVDLNYNEDSEGNSQNSQKMTSSITDTLQNSGLDKLPDAFHTPSVKKPQSLEPMELLGSPWRNVQLPFSVIYVAKGKSRPELSARYLIRHMFTEDVLVKSNVYGNLERGMNPLDCNRINALRDFLQENYPSFDLKETGYDWKACVAAINSTIRSLRHDHKKATIGIRRKVSAVPPLSAKSPPRSPTSVKPFESDTINLTD
ncbi:BEN domain-containing protein 2 isoform 4-T10 [Alca torda]